MKLKTFTLRTNLLSKLLLSLALLIGSTNVWASITDNGDGTLTEDFTGASRSYSGGWILTLPSGWSYSGSAGILNVSTSSGTYITSPSLYVASSNSENFYITPELEGNFSFYMRCYSAASDAKVEAYEFTYVNDEWVKGSKIDEVSVSKANPIAPFAPKIISYGGHGHVGLLLSSVYIDDFAYTPYYEVGEIAVPTGLTASGAPTSTSVELSWTAGGDETTWQLSYGTTSGSLNQKSGYITSNTFTLSGLAPNTPYYVSVRALKDVYSVWSGEYSFTTAGDVAVTGVSVTPTSWQMLAGDTKALTEEVTPADATDKTVSWKSNNTSVATVSSEGVVTAVAPGIATITVKSTADPTIQATCAITVSTPVTPTAFKAKEITKDYAYLTWTNGSDETTWQIKYRTTSGELNKESGDMTTKPYLITGLASNTTYYASIRSKLGTAYSAWSDEISFTTPVLGPAPGGDFAATENFNAGWPVKSNTLTGVKEGWGYLNGYNSYKLDETYRRGDSGYGLSSGYNTSNHYIITPIVKAGSTISFWACKASLSAYVAAELKLYKAIKVEGSYYVDTSVQYASETPTETTMSSYESSTITEGGYVAIYLKNAAIDDFSYTALPTATVITDNNGYATFASSNKLDLTEANLPDGLLAYKAKVDGSTVKFTPLDQNVPENTGVLLEGAAYTEYKIAVASESTTVEDNEFLVNNGGLVAESGYTYYALKKNSNPLVFATFNPSTVVIPSNKAYLKVENEYAVKGLSFEFDNPTAVQSIKEAQPAVKGAVYDLSGRRVAQPKKGLYIIDGKKVVIK